MGYIPQAKLLEHPRCKAFVTHGGGNSIKEGVKTCTPMIITPVYGDQISNGGFITQHGLGLTTGAIESFTEKKFLTTWKQFMSKTHEMQANLEIASAKLESINEDHIYKFIMNHPAIKGTS